MKKGFTLIELVMIIVIIGILAAFAIPKFSRVTDSARISAELSTAYAISTAIETANGEWLINEGNFKWGNNRPSSDLNQYGYPKKLGDGDGINYVIRSQIDKSKFRRVGVENNGTIQKFKGEASLIVTKQTPGKPDKGDYWEYNSTSGTFRLIEDEQ